MKLYYLAPFVTGILYPRAMRLQWKEEEYLLVRVWDVADEHQNALHRT